MGRAPLTLTAIYARAANGVIGMDGALPWHIPADLKRFKALTMGADGLGRPMIMGRKTFESFGKPLPGRRHVVLTRDADWSAPGAEVVRTPGEALACAARDNPAGEASVVGGAQVYGLLLPLCARVELTEIHADYPGDTHLPALDMAEWDVILREDHHARDGVPAYSYVTLQRRRG
ncbi:MAG: dihydrofolate reductase [Sphingomonadales bacterium]|nr:dihydrofolate reductase [Sphingomonadales bacterium]MBD3774245.1 dihydrofolate reductase [Paracoccaceae bacterium]